MIVLAQKCIENNGITADQWEDMVVPSHLQTAEDVKEQFRGLEDVGVFRVIEDTDHGVRTVQFRVYSSRTYAVEDLKSE